jgi:hypothetical protein
MALPRFALLERHRVPILRLEAWLKRAPSCAFPTSPPRRRRRLGIIEFGITDTPTATNRPSYIKFYNTPPGSADSRGDFYMANGQLLGLNVGAPGNPIYGLPCGEESCGAYGDPLGIKFATWGLNGMPLGGSGFNFPDDAYDTTLTLVIRKANDVFETKPVSVGDADSCGTGYRCLRVRN